MNRRMEEQRSRRGLLPLALVFVLGLLLGWWVIGWWLWPVSYTNALPPDLRPGEKQQYLMMVADSYAVTGNLALAEQRTSSWTPAQLATDLNTVQSNLSQQNPVAADNLRRLATALQVPAATGAGAGAGQVPAQPAQPAQSAQPAGGLLQRTCSGLLWVVLVLGGIVAVLFLWNSWRKSQPGQGGLPAWRRGRPAEGSERGAGETEGGTAGEAADVGDISSRPTDSLSGMRFGEAAGARIYDAGDGQQVSSWGRESARAGLAEPDSTLPASHEPPIETGDEVQDQPWDETGRSAASQPPSIIGEPSTAGSRLKKVDERTAVYFAGESDLDEAFDYRDPARGLKSEYGLRVWSPPSGGGPVEAFAAWLFDAKDTMTQNKVLMSEAAYRDTAKRDLLARGDTPVLIKPGTEFDVETRHFDLYGKVEEIAYAEEEPRNQVFRWLKIQYQLYQKT